jgi:hypothetical protein
VYAGGHFTSIGGATRNRIAALDATTGTATAWDPNADYAISALVVSGSTVYAGGGFNSIGGQARNHIAALDATTGAATAWDPNADSGVFALAMSGDTLCVGGGFRSIGGQAQAGIASFGLGGSVVPLCEVTPSSVDFGPVEVETWKDTTFTIRNAGGGTVAGNVSEMCSDFTVLSGGGAFNLGMDEAVTVTIRFQPTVTHWHDCLVDLGTSLCERLVLVSDRFYGLRVFNAEDPAAPSEAGTHVTDSAYNLSVSGNYAYVADDSLGFKIFDISDPTSPVLVGSHNTRGSARDVFVSGHYAYVADLHPGLHIFDISDPANPDSLGNYDSSSACGVVVVGDLAYVADGSGGLRIFDVSDRTNPTLEGTCPTPGDYSRDLFIIGDYAYVADGVSGLQVIDVSVPTGPTIVGSCDTLGYAWGVHVAGDYAYVADASAEGRLRILDVSVPTNPVLVWQDPTPRPSTGVFVSGHYAYVAASGTGLMVFDVSDPVDADHVLTETTPTGARGVVVRGGCDVALLGYGTISTGIEDRPAPDAFALYQNIPNPFNPSTVIRYDVPPGGGRVSLRIYDVAGRLVRTLVDADETAGVKQVTWDGRNSHGNQVATGVYFYRMTAPGFTTTRRMVLLR